MRRSFLPSACLAAGALLCLAASAPAAPAPPSSDLDKYLPDDAVFVGVVNVKKITAWPPFQKQFQDQFQQLLKTETAQRVLKDTGFDPLRDLDRVLIVEGVSSYPETFTPSSSGHNEPTFFLAHGRFDPDKIASKLRQAAKDTPGLVKSRKVEDIEMWEIGASGDSIFLAVFDKETVMACDVESQATEAMEKAAGKKKTQLKDKRMQAQLTESDPKLAVEWFGNGDMVTSASRWADTQGHTGAERTFLRDQGIETTHGGVSLDNSDIHVQMTFRAVDADKAKAMVKDLNGEIAEFARQVKDQPDKVKDLTPLVESMKNSKITAAGDLVTLTGSATPEVIEGVYRQSIFRPEPPGAASPPDPKKDK